MIRHLSLISHYHSFVIDFRNFFFCCSTFVTQNLNFTIITLSYIGKIGMATDYVVLKFLSYFLNVVGVRYEADGKFLTVYGGFLCFTLCLGTSIPLQLIDLYLLRTDKPVIYIRSLSYILHGFCPNLTTILIFFNGSNMVRLMNFRQDRHKYRKSGGIVDEYFTDNDRRFGRFLVPYGCIIMVIGICGITASPLIFCIFGDVPIGSDLTRVYMAWSPWKIDTVWKYAIDYALQCFQVAFLVGTTLMNLFFVVYFMTEVQTQTNVLCTCIDRMVDRAKFTATGQQLSTTGKIEPPDEKTAIKVIYDRILEESLTDIIEYYSLVIR